MEVTYIFSDTSTRSVPWSLFREFTRIKNRKKSFIEEHDIFVQNFTCNDGRHLTRRGGGLSIQLRHWRVHYHNPLLRRPPLIPILQYSYLGSTVLVTRTFSSVVSRVRERGGSVHVVLFWYTRVWSTDVRLFSCE